MVEASDEVAHGPCALPAAPLGETAGMPSWVLAQTWKHMLFAHWQVDPALLRRHVPPELELDLFEGTAWVGVLPFEMADVHLRLLPPLPGTGRFLETNVRTYVRHQGRPGIWFFSLEATSRQAVEVARTVVRLPYRHAAGVLHVRRDGCRYLIRRSERGYPPARLWADYRGLGPLSPSAPGTIEEFLTERYRLFVVPRPGVVRRTEIEHPPWQVAAAAAEVHQDGLIPPDLATGRAPDLLHVGETRRVLTWPPVRRLRWFGELPTTDRRLHRWRPSAGQPR